MERRGIAGSWALVTGAGYRRMATTFQEGYRAIKTKLLVSMKNYATVCTEYVFLRVSMFVQVLSCLFFREDNNTLLTTDKEGPLIVFTFLYALQSNYKVLTCKSLVIMDIFDFHSETFVEKR